MTTIKSNRSEALSRSDRMLGGLLALLVIGGLLGGLYLYHTVRTFVAQSQLPIFPEVGQLPEAIPTAASASTAVSDPTPGSDVSAPAPILDEGAAPDAPPTASGEAAVPAATERLTVLIMGIDRREQEEGPWRTDSMILVSIDPETDTVAMLSTPRDLYVTIPDYGRGEYLDRINTAYFHGDAADYPGGGAALAKQTIRRNFGIEVDRYIVMDFNGFRRVIDEIGGVEIDVPDLLIDTEYPTEDYGYMTVRFEEGKQWMDGERALIYSRTRKSTSDFARAERQQEVILAVRDRVLSLDIIPSLTPTRLARLARTLDDSIQTDMTLDEVLALAQVARRIDERHIHRFVIDSTLIYDHRTPEGAQVLLPKWDEILPIVEETFEIDLLPIAATPTPPPPPPTATPRPVRPTQPPRVATVRVLNGTTTAGLEETVAGTLQQAGFTVTDTGQSARDDVAQTVIFYYSEAGARLAQQIQARYLPSSLVSEGSSERSGGDVVIIVGQDMAGSSGQ